MIWKPKAPLAMPLTMVILAISRRPAPFFFSGLRKLPRGMLANMGTTRIPARSAQVSDQSCEITCTPLSPRTSGPSSRPKNPPITEAGIRNLRKRGIFARRNIPARSSAHKPAVLLSKPCRRALVINVVPPVFFCVLPFFAFLAKQLLLLSRIIVHFRQHPV